MTVTDFITQIKTDPDFQEIFVRGRLEARWHGCRELRTRKNDHSAVAFDDIGNVTVLTSSGNVQQIDGADYAGR